MCEYMGGLYLVSGPDRSSCLAPCNPAFLLRIKYWGVGCTSGCTSGCTYSLAHLTTFNRSETLPCMLPNSLLPPRPPACIAQVLRPPAPPCQELPQEEVRAHQPAAPQEEAQVNPRAGATYRPRRAGGRAGTGWHRAPPTATCSGVQHEASPRPVCHPPARSSTCRLPDNTICRCRCALYYHQSWPVLNL